VDAKVYFPKYLPTQAPLTAATLRYATRHDNNAQMTQQKHAALVREQPPHYCTSLFHLRIGGGMAPFAPPAPGPLDDGREFEPLDGGAGRIGSEI
jgi:hypothetical protein